MKFNKRNIIIGKNVVIGRNVRIGDDSILYDNVVIEDNCIISNNCIIGEPLNSYYSDNNYINPRTTLRKGGLIRSHSIIYADCDIGAYTTTGHRVIIREGTRNGSHCMFGSNVDIQGDCMIGDYNRFHSSVIIGQKSKTGNFVFIYPYTVLTNDPTPPSSDLVGPFIDNFSQISASSVILPGTRIGKNCLVAAHSTVGGEYPDDSYILGSPARLIGKLSKMPFYNKNGIRHYPWQKNYIKGMPWNEKGFESWKNKNDKIS